MPYDMYFIEEHRVLLVAASGPLDAEHAEAMGLDVINRLHEHGSSKLLVDLREIDVKMPTDAIYELSSHLDHLGLERNDRVAHLISHDWAAHRLFETVALNRGFAVGVFEEYEKAIHWLTDDRHSTTQSVSRGNAT